MSLHNQSLNSAIVVLGCVAALVGTLWAGDRRELAACERQSLEMWLMLTPAQQEELQQNWELRNAILADDL